MNRNLNSADKILLLSTLPRPLASSPDLAVSLNVTAAKVHGKSPSDLMCVCVCVCWPHPSFDGGQGNVFCSQLFMFLDRLFHALSSRFVAVSTQVR